MRNARPYGQYALAAELFRYPGADFQDRVAAVYGMLRAQYPEAADTLLPFAQWVDATPAHHVEEVFSRTFHVQAICYLDIGFVLFGEDYKRGEFLVNMKQEQAMAGNDCGEELPDNLVNVLTLLPLLRDEAFRAELAGRVLMPALRRMMAEFSPAKSKLRTNMLRRKHKALIMAEEQHINVYHHALLALFHMLVHDFDEVALVEYKPTGPDPLRAAAPASDCGTCNSPHSPRINTMKP
ncbi:MAG: hypothetical protein KBH07_01835 [Flavobacteriales bacterium]|nr:hypothetical protein [Flavobacteriales bacterium]MBP9078653.1 hypothetical protein [Flavobacteriales bacterium]